MRLLIVGTLNDQLGEATKIALNRGAKVSHADSIDMALTTLRSGRGADLVMIDCKFDIAEFIERATSEHIYIPVVACGIGTDTQAAVSAIRAGAKEYVPLPPDPDLIAAVLEAVAEDTHALLFSDPQMARVVELAEQVAPSDASILVTGESGTGKEMIARYLHKKSNRPDKPFVTVNCAAIPDNLLESELFGHEKGAFTGAIARRIGKFEEADGGTLLLDEISEMEVRLQAKLLRAIQEREIDRVGGSKPIKLNIRVIATSNRDLAEEVTNGNFREDLLYRLNVVNLKVPPLRERKADIRLLAMHFAEKYAEANQLPNRPVSEDTITMLEGHYWKGNVRELENTLHRAILLAQGDEITPEAILLPDGTSPAGGSDPEADFFGSGDSVAGLVGRKMSDVERDLILDTLNHCLGNRTHAATILGISIRTLRNKLRSYSDAGFNIPIANQSATST